MSEQAVGPKLEAGGCLSEHIYHAFDALYCSLTRARPVPPTFQDDKYALFITWNTVGRRGDYRLRGCIGNFTPMPLREGISEYALISALEDSRFRPIQRSELEKLECVVSLLVDFEDAADHLDWTVGVHGIHISFQHPFYNTLSNDSSNTPLSLTPVGSSGTARRKYSATYLPEVIPAQGWTKLEAIDSAIHKAGWNGAITDELRRSIHLRRYQSSKKGALWDEYVKWRISQGGLMK